MSDETRARPDHPVHDLIAARFSPYAFDERAVPRQDLCSVFEAARWAASSFNEQPWRFIIATTEDRAEYERLLSCLVEGNQGWAGRAPVLALGIVRRAFSRNDKPNRVCEHDLGLAAGSLTFEATARGLFVHQMAGILPDRARELYGIPPGYDAITALAIGYRGDPGDAADELAQRDRGARSRKSLSEIVFSGSWERPALGG